MRSILPLLLCCSLLGACHDKASETTTASPAAQADEARHNELTGDEPAQDEAGRMNDSDAILSDSAESAVDTSTTEVGADPSQQAAVLDVPQMQLRGFPQGANQSPEATQLPGFATHECERSQGAAACEAGQWCEPPAGQCAASTGLCQPMAEICTQEYQPVCGCDGQTYSNRCARQRAQVGEAYVGECGRE